MSREDLIRVAETHMLVSCGMELRTACLNVLIKFGPKELKPYLENIKGFYLSPLVYKQRKLLTREERLALNCNGKAFDIEESQKALWVWVYFDELPSPTTQNIDCLGTEPDSDS